MVSGLSVAKKYRRAYLRKIRRKEYRKLKAVVPAVARQEKVSKVSRWVFFIATDTSLLTCTVHIAEWDSLQIVEGKNELDSRLNCVIALRLSHLI